MDESSREPGVSDSEREVLNELTGLNAGRADEDRGEVGVSRFSKTRSLEPPRTGPLTEAESVVRRKLLGESSRIVREMLPEMFPETGGEELNRAEVGPAREEIGGAGGSGGLSSIGAFVVEVLSLPARRFGPAVVTGMGFAGIFLLTVLLVVLILGIMRH